MRAASPGSVVPAVGLPDGDTAAGGGGAGAGTEGRELVSDEVRSGTGLDAGTVSGALTEGGVTETDDVTTDGTEAEPEGGGQKNIRGGAFCWRDHKPLAEAGLVTDTHSSS